MQQQTALRSGKSKFSGLPALRAEPRRSKGLECALGLGCENGRSSADLAGREGNPTRVPERNREPQLSAGWNQLGGKRQRRSGKTLDEARRTGLSIGFLGCVTEVDDGRRLQQASRHGFCQIPIVTDRDVRHAEFALQKER